MVRALLSEHNEAYLGFLNDVVALTGTGSACLVTVTRGLGSSACLVTVTRGLGSSSLSSESTLVTLAAVFVAKVIFGGGVASSSLESSFLGGI